MSHHIRLKRLRRNRETGHKLDKQDMKWLMEAMHRVGKQGN